MISPAPGAPAGTNLEGSHMGKFIRRLMMGAAVVWGVKSFQDKRREWSGRSSSEIRQDVKSKLPAGMDEESKDRVADKVVQAVKGDAASEPPSATTTPPPETPMTTPTGSGTPPPPPAGEETL